MTLMPDQYEDFCLTPDFSDKALHRSLQNLLVGGIIEDSRLERYCDRLCNSYHRLCTFSTQPLWSAGIVITAEMRRQSELYLPIKDLRSAFLLFARLSCRHTPFKPALEQLFRISWYDALARIWVDGCPTDPGRVLRLAAKDESFRLTLLAAIFNPSQYGGAFQRYHGQLEFISSWLKADKPDKILPLRLLDLACGCGELCYDLAKILQANGFNPEQAKIEGLTVEPLELVAAANCWFPHDRSRESSFRKSCTPLLEYVSDRMISFISGDILRTDFPPENYDLVVCNGLVGGPILNDPKDIERLGGLVSRILRKNGIFLLSDRFHAGWRRKIPFELIASMLDQQSLRQLACRDGLAFIKP